MNISFEGQALHDICNEQQKAEEEFGSLTAKDLVTLLGDVRASDNAQSLIDLYDSVIEISDEDILSVFIGEDYCAQLMPVGTRCEYDAECRVKWSSVTRLKLLRMSRAQ